MIRIVKQWRPTQFKLQPCNWKSLIPKNLYPRYEIIFISEKAYPTRLSNSFKKDKKRIMDTHTLVCYHRPSDSDTYGSPETACNNSLHPGTVLQNNWWLKINNKINAAVPYSFFFSFSKSVHAYNWWECSLPETKWSDHRHANCIPM